MPTPCIIVDLDGTAANDAWRLPMIGGLEPNFKKYFESLMGDPAHYHVLRVMRAMNRDGVVSIISTGRPDLYRKTTEAWLLRHDIEYALLLMRAPRDQRQDQLVKKIHLVEIRAAGYEPLFAIDDRERVVNMWRANHVPCLAMEDVGKRLTTSSAFNEE